MNRGAGADVSISELGGILVTVLCLSGGQTALRALLSSVYKPRVCAAGSGTPFILDCHIPQ